MIYTTLGNTETDKLSFQMWNDFVLPIFEKFPDLFPGSGIIVPDPDPAKNKRTDK